MCLSIIYEEKLETYMYPLVTKPQPTVAHTYTLFLMIFNVKISLFQYFLG